MDFMARLVSAKGLVIGSVGSVGSVGREGGKFPSH
jgi:hypothetical protein